MDSHSAQVFQPNPVPLSSKWRSPNMTTRFRPIAIALAFATIALVVIAAFSSTGVAGDPTPTDVKNEFAGKIVTVYLSDPLTGNGEIMTDVELLTIGGRLMLVGTGADTGDDKEW